MDKLLKGIIEGIQEKKGKNIITLDLSSIPSASAQYFVICEGTSPSQTGAIADSIREYVQKNINIKPVSYDGYKNAQWIALDYGNVFVHIFLPEQRNFYKLEQLWNDAKLTVIPNLE